MPAPDPRPLGSRRVRLRRFIADACHLALSTTLWLGGTLGFTVGDDRVTLTARMPL